MEKPMAFLCDALYDTYPLMSSTAPWGKEKRQERNMCLALRIWVAGGRGVWKSIHKRQNQLWKYQLSRQQRGWLGGRAAEHGLTEKVNQLLCSPRWISSRPSLLLADHVWKLTPTYRDIRVRLYAWQSNHVHLFVCKSVYWLTPSSPDYPFISSHICKYPSIYPSTCSPYIWPLSLCPLVCLLMSLFPTILQRIVSGLQKTHTINRPYIHA